MTIPGLVWLPGGRMTPAQLTTRLQSVLGATLTRLHLGDDLVTSAGLVASSPGRVGPTLTNTGATQFTASVSNGRTCFVATANAPAQLGYADAAAYAQTMIVVCKVGATSVAYQTLGGGNILNQTAMFMRNNTGTGFFPRGVHYVNGVASEVFPTSAQGIVISECVLSPNTVESGIGFGGNSVLGRCGDDTFFAALQLSAPMTPTQRTQVTAALASYYSIPLP